MRRSAYLTVLLLSLGASATAQAPAVLAAPAVPSAPAGWNGQTDKADSKLADVNFVTMGPGMHVTSGPAVTFWSDANTASGAFTAGANFGQRVAPTDPAGYGLVWGAAKLGTPQASYLFFLVRGDGKFTVRHQASISEVHTITDWTSSVALNAPDPAKGGSASNALEVRVAADSVRLFANGKPVTAYSTKVMNSNDGVIGFRTERGVNLHVGSFGKR